MGTEKDNVIVNMSFEFALKIVKFSEILEQRKKWKLADQIFRSGTSIGANVHEAQNAESKADFIHKFKICAKEAEETFFWLKLCNKSENLPDCEPLIEDLTQIRKVIGRIITSSKNN
jgi:four helix bundle protein